MARVTQHSDPIEAKLERLGLDVQYEPEAARFDAAQGLYWFCSDNYSGQGDPLYSVLSRLEYRPGVRETGPQLHSEAEGVYEALLGEELDAEELLTWIEGRRANPRRRTRRNPKVGFIGKRLKVGNTSVMTVEDDQGFYVVIVRGDTVTPFKDYATRAEALAGATLAYETLKHQGRINPCHTRRRRR